MNRVRVIIGAAFSVLMTVIIVGAQPGAASCIPFIEQAIQQLGNNCEGLDRNNACYGYTLVQAALTDDAEEVQFNVPRDRAGLLEVNSLRTAALDEENDTWGIAVLNTQANLPGTLPGQGVVMMMIGEAEMRNDVAPEDVVELQPFDAVVTADDAGARIRTGAGTNFNIRGVIPSGETVSVDGRSTDGEWVRVVSGDTTGWTFTDLLEIDGTTAADLPVIDDTIQSPMQAVYFRSGIGVAGCEPAPDALVVQSPKNTTVDLVVNESEISISSTVIIETLADGRMVIYVVDGEALVNNLLVPAGWKAFVTIEDRDDLLASLSEQEIDVLEVSGNEGLPAVSGPWESCDPISDEDRTWLNTLTLIDEGLLNYEIEQAPDADGICAPPNQIASGPSTGGTGGGAPAGLGVDCTAFGINSPSGGMSWGTETFYMEPAPGAALYRVEVYRGTDTSTPITAGVSSSPQVTVNTGTQDDLGSVTYSFRAIAVDANGTDACTTPLISVSRGAAPSDYLNRFNVEPSSDPGPVVIPTTEYEEEECVEC